MAVQWLSEKPDWRFRVKARHWIPVSSKAAVVQPILTSDVTTPFGCKRKKPEKPCPALLPVVHFILVIVCCFIWKNSPFLSYFSLSLVLVSHVPHSPSLPGVFRSVFSSVRLVFCVSRSRLFLKCSLLEHCLFFGLFILACTLTHLLVFTAFCLVSSLACLTSLWACFWIYLLNHWIASAVHVACACWSYLLFSHYPACTSVTLFNKRTFHSGRKMLALITVLHTSSPFLHVFV